MRGLDLNVRPSADLIPREPSFALALAEMSWLDLSQPFEQGLILPLEDPFCL